MTEKKMRKIGFELPQEDYDKVLVECKKRGLKPAQFSKMCVYNVVFKEEPYY